MQNIKNKAFTHGGRFHADDVFSAALLKILNPDITIIRGYEVPQNFDGIVFDIGDGEFDHHDKNSPKRENGVPYASFGLLWKKYGHTLVGEEQAKRVDKHFVQPLDLDDNTGAGNQIAQLIGAYNPEWDSQQSSDECFDKALNIAHDLLVHKINSLKSIQRAAKYVEDALKNAKGKIVILEQFAPYKQQLIPSDDALFVVYPSQRGGYSAQGIQQSFASPQLKVPFPQAWAGLNQNELKVVSNIDGLKFCHAGRFLITTATKQDAINACKAAIEEYEQEKE